MDENLVGIDAIQADATLSDEVKLLATDAASLDTVETIAELKDVDGVVTFAALCARMKEANPDAKDSDIEAATIAWWIY
jgi:hypothetical protein